MSSSSSAFKAFVKSLMRAVCKPAKKLATKMRKARASSSHAIIAWPPPPREPTEEELKILATPKVDIFMHPTHPDRSTPKAFYDYVGFRREINRLGQLCCTFGETEFVSTLFPSMTPSPINQVAKVSVKVERQPVIIITVDLKIVAQTKPMVDGKSLQLIRFEPLSTYQWSGTITANSKTVASPKTYVLSSPKLPSIKFFIQVNPRRANWICNQDYSHPARNYRHAIVAEQMLV
jgi:hypothetical protein